MAVKEVAKEFYPPLNNGWGFFIQPPDQKGTFETEGEIGKATDVFFQVLGSMGGWEKKKVDESIEISPEDSQYYGLVIGQKQELENRIKTGLGQAATAIGDYELLLHDKRKLDEFLEYFNKIEKAKSEYKEAKTDEDKKKKRKTVLDAEMAIKSIFIDQVDAHTTQSALTQIVQRWPTIIVDFQSITDFDIKKGNENEVDNETAADRIQNELPNISRAEALVLAVKQKLYIEWKKMFLNSIKERYSRVIQLTQGRKTSIDKYREWLKPYIARHKMIEEAFENIDTAAEFSQKTDWISGTGKSNQTIKAWAWKALPQLDYHKITKKRVGKEFLVDPFDDNVKALCFGGKFNGKTYSGYKTEWVKKDGKKVIRYKRDENGKPIKIEGDKNSLIKEYQGLTPEIVYDEWWLKGIKKGSLDGSSPLDPNSMYYAFMILELDRNLKRDPKGNVSESASITVTNHCITQNFLLVKILELKAAEHEFKNQVDEILGLSIKDGDEGHVSIKDFMKEKYPDIFGEKSENKNGNNDNDKSKKSIISSITQPFSDIKKLLTSFNFKPVFIEPIQDTFTSLGNEIEHFLKKYGIKISILKGKGPYESDFKDRITTTYLKAVGGEWGGVSGTLRSILGA